MPAGILIVLILGGIAVDRAVIFDAQRDLVATAQAAANDAAAVGTDVTGIRNGQTRGFDRGRLDRAIRLAVRADDDPDHPATVSWSVRDGTITVVLTRTVPRVFTKAIGSPTTTVTARATATLEAPATP